MDQRNELIDAWLKRERTITELSRAYGIARKTVYKWIERFEEGGRVGLAERSRAPLNSPQSVSEEIVRAIVAVREKHPTWGPVKIREKLKPGQRPAASTIGEVLKRAGLRQPRQVRRRTPPYESPLGHATAPNHVWCADFKGYFRCGDGVRCDPFTMTDAWSRYLLRCRATEKTDGPHVRALMESVFREYGLPEAIRTDNGPPFASKAPGGLSRLSMWWLQLGIRHERIDPGCPQQNGRHERMHRTLQEDTANPPSANLRKQQAAFCQFERIYNHERPHEALSGKTPGSCYVASTRVYPARLPELEYPAGVHMRRISQQGSLKWKCERTFLSEVLARQLVGLLETQEDLFEVYYGPLLIGWFDARSHAFAPQKREPQKRRARAGKGVEMPQ